MGCRGTAGWQRKELLLITCQLLLPHQGKLLDFPSTDISARGLAPLPRVDLK